MTGNTRRKSGQTAKKNEEEEEEGKHEESGKKREVRFRSLKATGGQVRIWIL